MLRRHATLTDALRRSHLLIVLLAIIASLITVPAALAAHPRHHHGAQRHARRHAKHHHHGAHRKRTWRTCGTMTLHGEHVQIRAHHVACRKARGLIRRFSRPHASMKIAPGWECQLGGTGLPVLEYCASPTLAHYDRWAEAYSKTAYSHPKQAPNPSSPIEGVAWAPPPHWCSLEQKCSDEEITTHDCGQLQQDCEAPLCARSRNQYLWGVKISDEGAQKLTTDESAVGSALVDIGAGIQVQASANLAIYCGEHDFEAAKAEGAEQADRLTLTIEVPLVKSAELATVLSTVIEGAEAEDPGFAANLHTSGSVDGWGYSASAGVDGLSLSISLTPPAQAG